MKLWIKILSVFFLFSLIFWPKTIEARSGCCSHHDGVCGCDTSVGTQVCCDGSYSPSCGCIYNPSTPTPIIFPNMNATWNYYPNNNKTFSLSVTLNDSNPSQYSAVINKCKGCDPGPKTDFYSNNFIFNNLKTGNYYLNVKKSINGYWSTVSYWTISIPEWSAPTPTPIPTILPLSINNTQTSTDNGSSIVGFLFLITFGFGLLFAIYKFIKWFLNYAKNHDWVYPTLFWIILIGGAIIYSLVSDTSNNTAEKYVCNCSKTCPNMTCKEAYYQLNECGCSKRDGDGDGIPCEEQCN